MADRTGDGSNGVASFRERGHDMNIVCAVDGSEFSNWALEASSALFHQALKHVVLLHVIDTRQLRSSLRKEGADPKQVQDAIERLEAEAQKVLKAARETMELALSQAVTYPLATMKTVLAKGHVADTIIKRVEKIKPDLLVVGSRGLSDLEGYLLGSVSRRVLVHAPCPVLAVKRSMKPPIRTVIAVDGSKASNLAATRFRSWTVPETVSVHILSVVPDILTDVASDVLPDAQIKALQKPFQLRAEEVCARYRQWFLGEGFAVTAQVLAGNPREVILDYLARHKADVVVLGSKGLTGADRFRMGSVSEGVAAYAPCSVLIVRSRPS